MDDFLQLISRFNFQCEHCFDQILHSIVLVLVYVNNFLELVPLNKTCYDTVCTIFISQKLIVVDKKFIHK